MKVLVCGGRNYDDWRTVHETLDALKPSMIVHGNAPGADTLADRWALDRKVATAKYPADWATHGRAAGPIRNQTMLDREKPDLVLAFPDGRGTDDMVRRATAAGVRVLALVADAGALVERNLIAKYIEENAVLLSGHVRKPWLALAASIRACEHHEDERTAEPSSQPQTEKTK